VSTLSPDALCQVTVSSSVAPQGNGHVYAFTLTNGGPSAVFSFSLTCGGPVSNVTCPNGWSAHVVDLPLSSLVFWTSAGAEHDLPAPGALSGFGLNSLAAPGDVAYDITNVDANSSSGVVSGPSVMPEPTVTLGVSCRAVRDFVTRGAVRRFRFKIWGRVSVLTANSFTLDDGSGRPVTVVSQGFTGIKNGDYASASGTFSSEETGRVLNAVASDVKKM